MLAVFGRTERSQEVAISRCLHSFTRSLSGSGFFACAEKLAVYNQSIVIGIERVAVSHRIQNFTASSRRAESWGLAKMYQLFGSNGAIGRRGLAQRAALHNIHPGRPMVILGSHMKTTKNVEDALING